MACTGHQKREASKLSPIEPIALGQYLVKCKQQGKFFFFKSWSLQKSWQSLIFKKNYSQVFIKIPIVRNNLKKFFNTKI